MSVNQENSEIDLSLLVPVFNEEAAIPQFMDSLGPVMAKLGMRWEVVFINDGSTDGTLDILQALRRQHIEIRVIDFSRNFGKEAALTAGLDFSRGRAVIPIDVDLQGTRRKSSARWSKSGARAMRWCLPSARGGTATVT